MKPTLLLLLLLAAVALSLSLGAENVSFREAFSDPQSLSRLILLEIRLPRILLGGLVGLALASAGAALPRLAAKSPGRPLHPGRLRRGGLGKRARGQPSPGLRICPPRRLPGGSGLHVLDLWSRPGEGASESPYPSLGGRPLQHHDLLPDPVLQLHRLHGGPAPHLVSHGGLPRGRGDAPALLGGPLRPHRLFHPLPGRLRPEPDSL